MHSNNLSVLSSISDFISRNYGNDFVVFESLQGDEIKSYTSFQFSEISDKIAVYLETTGIQSSDKIVTILDNSPAWNFIEVGILKADAVHVPVSVLYSKEQLKYILTVIEPSLVICGFLSLHRLISQIIAQEKLAGRAIGLADFMKEVTPKEQRTRFPKNTVHEDKEAVILFTTGTSGLPKGVVLTNRNILTSIKEFSSTDILKKSKLYLSFLPFCHSGERKVSYSCLLTGIKVCYSSTHLSLSENIKLFKPDITAMVPYLVEKLVDEISTNKTFKLPRPLNIICGGAPLREEVIAKAAKNNMSVIEVYGLTETASLLSYNTLAVNKTGTAGKVASSVSVTMGSGREILVKGNNLMKGYISLSGSINLPLDRDGWFHTGDRGVIDQDGFLKVTGRISNTFKNSKGEFVHPEPIEQELKKNPYIKNVVVFSKDGYLAAVLVLKGIFQNHEKPEEVMKNEIEKFNLQTSDKIEFFTIVKSLEPLLNANFKVGRENVKEYFQNYNFISITKTT